MSFEPEADVGDRSIRFGGDAEIVFDQPAEHMRIGYPRLGRAAPAGEVGAVDAHELETRRYVRREAITVRVPGTGARLETVVELSGSGTGYDIEPPAAAHVTDISEQGLDRA